MTKLHYLNVQSIHAINKLKVTHMHKIYNIIIKFYNDPNESK